MPADFPVEPYQALHARITQKMSFQTDTGKQFAGAWNAVAYRFIATAEDDEAFSQSVRAYGGAPSPKQRYEQERCLFGFFTAGLATLESFCYGLFAVASIVDPTNFLF